MKSEKSSNIKIMKYPERAVERKKTAYQMLRDYLTLLFYDKVLLQCKQN